MKKIIYIILVFIAVLSFSLDVNACTGSDGCTNCGNSSAEIACKQSAAYKQYQNSLNNNGNNNSGNNSSGDGLPSAGAGTVIGGNNGTSSGKNNEVHNIQQTVTGTDKEDDELECKYIFGDDTATGKYMRDIYNIIKFLVPILLLGLSIKDYASAIINQNQDGVKKATKSFIKRLVVAVIILVMPTIINFILEDLLEIEQCI